jgi:hypothetical protein
MRLLVVAILLGLAQSVSAWAEDVPDACRAKIPPSVARTLTQRFPAYRLPVVTDNMNEDVRFSLAHGGDGCLLVASGDFDGDGHQDFAVGLPPNKGNVPIVAVAFARVTTWAITTVKSWVDGPMRLYVSAVPPGVHKRTGSLDVPLKPSERQVLRCRHDAVEVGATESTGVAYCYTNKQWLYVWVSD